MGEDDYDELAKQTAMLPEELALGRTIEYFGPVTPNFLKHTNNEQWVKVPERLQHGLHCGLFLFILRTKNLSRELPKPQKPCQNMKMHPVLMYSTGVVAKT